MSATVRRVLDRQNQPWVLLGLMVFDLLVNAAATEQQRTTHCDRMRVDASVRKAIMPVKLLGTFGLLVGRRSRPLAILTTACFVVYFVIAFGFHRRVNDGPVLTAPAVIFGGVAARALAAEISR